MNRHRPTRRKAKAHLLLHEFAPSDGQRYIGLDQSKAMLNFLHKGAFHPPSLRDVPGCKARFSVDGFNNDKLRVPHAQASSGVLELSDLRARDPDTLATSYSNVRATSLPSSA
ncbi:hypothetical protein AYO21_10065 [Fonsecaea monophora]|uniref:Uncharacterized protein n=1 Tax=Fonsecaea monophora TaxID=254056 RepID=A0A177EUV2_9EURO|nr:hypothetical protein AYO21_10065 [Fonsecaea monophora]OAG35748.1 hypothetical protein AYO21_10065 [Fonsecaea monophora]